MICSEGNLSYSDPRGGLAEKVKKIFGGILCFRNYIDEWNKFYGNYIL